MYKILVFLSILMTGMFLYVQQLDHSLALHTLFSTQQHLNRAAHAAAQQLDEQLLTEGKLRIDEVKALQTFQQYLHIGLQKNNLYRDLEIVEMVFIQDTNNFPYVHVEQTTRSELTFNRPGVIIKISLKYNQLYSKVRPIEWNLISVAQLVY